MVSGWQPHLHRHWTAASPPQTLDSSLASTGIGWQPHLHRHWTAASSLQRQEGSLTSADTARQPHLYGHWKAASPQQRWEGSLTSTETGRQPHLYISTPAQVTALSRNLMTFYCIQQQAQAFHFSHQRASLPVLLWGSNINFLSDKAVSCLFPKHDMLPTLKLWLSSFFF